MSQLDMNNKRNKLAYLLSLFMVVTPQLAHSQSLLAQTAPETKHAVHDHSHGTAAYVCPMHPNETSHEAGSRCSICNMFLVEAEEEEEKGSHDDHLAMEQKTYVCPMHPDETSHEAGSRCSICNMFLVEAEEEEEKGSYDDHLAMEQKTYVCPMHPDETSHEAGSRCSICNMFLVEDEEEEEKGEMDHSGHDMSSMPTDEHAGHSHQAASTPAGAVFNAAEPASLNDGGSIKYVCPMHAHIISDVPGTCPICGMNLEKVEVGGSSKDIQIDVSGGMQQALALKVARVEKDTLWKFVQTVGQVDYDESQINHIHARVNGWIEKLTITSVGDKITKGQLLYEIYSPELINAQDDFLLAQDTVKRAGKDANYQDLVRKAGLRLELLGFQPYQIKALAKSKKTQYRVPFYAKSDGIVKALNVRDGMYIQPATEVMSVVDLSKVWVIADVFENEQSWLAVGQKAEISVPAMGIKDIEGEIDYIYPELDPVTRSLRVRIVVSNADIELRPNTLAKIGIFGGPNEDVLVIPQEALIQTGKENRVIVKLEDNSFTARKVTVGMLSQGKAEIKEGLAENERVVTSGQFLLDSEASLKGSLMRLSSGHQH
ncbi:efflux RND transporter periplasmic adaptor subunit [Shewanella nanhaiensis]|uniref:Efflux RND transporter periplasmic adaptor subunit n=1 Tax=Shewanella nanhaiensis TaxID=2864872 RepID=A0ABS7E6W2_9GAMM|nr:efflux RND transporter periplasmic adaptor subunit [Shewanella nanhaiensis]MBW8185314.1 efflux RND transporter periplasmic adaptor subunit [Shewanella nanhaiensis]